MAQYTERNSATVLYTCTVLELVNYASSVSSSFLLITLPSTMSETFTIAQHDCVLPNGLRARIFYPCISSANSRYGQWMPASSTRWSNENVRALFEYLGVPAAGLLSYVLGWALNARLSWRADEQVNTARKWPIVLLSHGLGSSLAGYVSTCAELASTGRIVVAVEHGDGSAQGAYIGVERRRVPYVHRPRDNRAHEQLAKTQNLQRVEEFDVIIEDLRAINAGTRVQTALPPFEDCVSFKECIDTDSPIIVAGHSFGCATALGYAIKSWNGRTKAAVSHVICLDPWLSPIGSDVLMNTRGSPDTRVLYVDQQQTGRTMSVALREDMNVAYKRVCVIGGLHNNATDFATKLPTIIAVAGKLAAERLDPERLMRAQNLAVCRFVGSDWDAFENDVAVGNVDSLEL